MKKRVLNRYGFRLLCLMLLFVGCSSEQLTNEQGVATGSRVEMRLQVSAPLGSYISDADNAINRLRVVVFGSVGSSDAGKLILNKYYGTAPAGNSLKEVITTGRRDVYVIVNEPLSGGGAELDSYKNIKSAADVRNLSLVYQGAGSVGIYTPTEIPMFIYHANQLIKADVTNEIGGAVERTMAKVTMKLNIKNSNFPTGKQVVIDNIQIKNLPEQSYFIAQNYTDALVSSEKQNVAVVAAASGYNFSSDNTFYVPEYIFNNPANEAYIEITGHVNGEANGVSKWTVKLGDAMDDGKAYGDRYHITRNRHYTFTGDVKSYGETDGLAVKVTVLPWNTVSQDDETGRFVAYSKVTDAADKVIADGSNSEEMTPKVVCNTNIGGWYTVTRDENNKIVHKSTPTASVSGATLQTVNVIIPPLDLIYEHNKYTINIYHPTIAQETTEPVKSFNIILSICIIPNSVLIAKGWPADKLPANGLQISKRGNQGVAKKEDPQLNWKVDNLATPNTSSLALGMGESNTNAMNTATHPVSRYCREMGPDWFVPSKNEWDLIYSQESTFGSSYKFSRTHWYYWSSTERDYMSVNVINVKDGTWTYSFKSYRYPYPTRCVRKI